MISKKILKIVGQTNARYGLIKDGDRVLLGLSGGKDSLTLAHTLKHIQKHAPFNFEFEAVTISYGMGENLDFLKEHCAKFEIPYSIYETPIFEVAQEKIRKNSSFCSFFSRMRRGALYTYAQEKGFNKLALAHHLDDAMESFFMNMFYNGSFRSMPPIYKAENGIFVIRPLIKARERQLRAFVDDNKFLVVGDEACPAMRFDVKMPHARANMKEYVSKLEEQFPDISKMVLRAFENIHDETFFDEKRFKL